MVTQNNKYITVLDIGSSKICGLTAQIMTDYQENERKIILKAAHSMPSQGIVNGEIDNITKVENSISLLIQALENQCNQPIDSVWINAISGGPKTEFQELETDINGYITQDHIQYLHNQVIDKMRGDHKYILHAIPIGYEVDGNPVKMPIGMQGKSLKAQMILVTAKLAQLRNLGISIERAHIEIAGRAVTPITAALGCLDQSEKDNGAICIDIGAETISICVFNNNAPIFVDILKLGADYITKDIARAFSISTHNAENIKRNNGSSVPSLHDEKETLELPIIGADYDITSFENRPKSHLTQIIRPRTEEMLEVICKRLQDLKILHPSYRIVLTGGGSALKGIEEVAAQIFGIRPRIACPLFDGTLPQAISGSDFAALIGLLYYALGDLNELPQHQLFSKLRSMKGFTGKMLNWLVQNF